jgi:hypothetical protein
LDLQCDGAALGINWIGGREKPFRFGQMWNGWRKPVKVFDYCEMRKKNERRFKWTCEVSWWDQGGC